jgi:hypothetical protein
MVWVLPSSMMYSSPLWVVLLETYSGYEATITFVVAPGFTTKLNSFLQSLVPYRRRKNPRLIARLESSRFKKATEDDLRGSEISPYCPGRMVPRLS